MASALTVINEWRCFDGRQLRLRHEAASLDGVAMTASVFLPPQAAQGPVPALWFLNGLTGTDENFMIKAGAQRLAADLGLALISPDTSPRGSQVPGDPDGSWDMGHGAGFYLNAGRSPWSQHYRMHDYVVEELPAALEAELPLSGAYGISGFSMGGHGALILSLRNPGRYRSVSAFAPIAHPSACPWGRKAFGHYLGTDQALWAEWDATRLIAGDRAERLPLLIDQGDQDEYLIKELLPQDFRAAAEAAGHPLTFRTQAGYDHSYWFVASFIEDHLHHHAAALIPV